MKSMPTPRPLLPFTAMFAGRRRVGAGADDAQDTRMPDDEDVLMLQSLASSQMGRIAAEVALEEGGRRQYAPRRETEVLEARQRREGAR